MQKASRSDRGRAGSRLRVATNQPPPLNPQRLRPSAVGPLHRPTNRPQIGPPTAIGIWLNVSGRGDLQLPDGVIPFPEAVPTEDRVGLRSARPATATTQRSAGPLHSFSQRSLVYFAVLTERYRLLSIPVEGIQALKPAFSMMRLACVRKLRPPRARSCPERIRPCSCRARHFVSRLLPLRHVSCHITGSGY